MDKEIAEKEMAEKLKSLTKQAEEYKVRSSTHSDQLQVLQTLTSNCFLARARDTLNYF